MTTAYLSLGSNLGDRLTYLSSAVQQLQTPHTRVQRVSSVYETAPQGKTDQPAFLNIAAQVETELAPVDLLHHIQRVEMALGRVRHERWGPRTLDIDIIFYGTTVIQKADLELPHPRMTDRAFVLVPLVELAPELVLPSGVTAQAALNRLQEQGVTLFLPAKSFHARARGVQ